MAAQAEAAKRMAKQASGLRRERDEWHLRCIELHHSLRTATASSREARTEGVGVAGAGGGREREASERILEVAKQQAEISC